MILQDLHKQAEQLYKDSSFVRALESFTGGFYQANGIDEVIATDCLIGMGKCYYKLTLLSDCIRVNEVVLQRPNISQDQKGISLVFKALAYWEKGDLVSAQRICKTVIAEISVRQVRGRALSLLGIILCDRYKILGEKDMIDAAIDAHLGSLELVETDAEKERRLHNLSWAYILGDNFQKAEEYLKSSMEHVRPDDLIQKAVALNLLAYIRIKQHKYQDAREILDEAFVLLQQAGQPGQIWLARNNYYRGLLHMQQNQSVEAEIYFAQALSYSSEKDLVRDAAKVYFDLYRLFAILDPQRSREYYAKFEMMKRKLEERREE